jgi:beta-fructofuranosidase
VTSTDPSFPRLHRRPDHGWINDPNGLAVIDGRFHVFYQYNPDAPVHANIHWGHVSSTDLVRWRQEPIALAPRAGGPDERGCWTGCLVDDQGTPTALYTAANAPHPYGGGVALATSDRAAISWTQPESLLEHSNEPLDIDVRDPYVFSFRGHRYAVQGGGRVGGSPRVLLYACDDLTHWTYLGDLLTPDDPIAAAYGDASVWECPNLFKIEGSWVLLASPLTIREEGLVFGEVFALIGQLEPDGDGLAFRPETASPVDSGASFYAPQVLVHGERRLLWGWTRDLGRSSEEIAAVCCGQTRPPSSRRSDKSAWSQSTGSCPRHPSNSRATRPVSS